MGSYQAMVPKATATRIDSWSINGVVKNLLARAFLSLKSSDSLGQWLSAIAGTRHDVVHRSYLHWLTIAPQTSDGSLGLWNMIGRGGSLWTELKISSHFPRCRTSWDSLWNIWKTPRATTTSRIASCGTSADYSGKEAPTGNPGKIGVCCGNFPEISTKYWEIMRNMNMNIYIYMVS